MQVVPSNSSISNLIRVVGVVVVLLLLLLLRISVTVIHVIISSSVSRLLVVAVYYNGYAGSLRGRVRRPGFRGSLRSSSTSGACTPRKLTLVGPLLGRPAVAVRGVAARGARPAPAENWLRPCASTRMRSPGSRTTSSTTTTTTTPTTTTTSTGAEGP